MDELLKKAAEMRGMPESLVQRSAQARAKKEGLSVEQVLAEWAGVDPSTVAAASPPPVDTPADATPAVEEATSTAEEDELEVEVLEPAAAETEAQPEPVVGGEPVSGRSRYPVLLTSMFLVIPALAVLYILAFPNGPDCGSAGQLGVDPVTGAAANCDGSAFGMDMANNFAAGQAIFEAQCAACHGANGGGGAGPAMAGGAVLVTFPAGSCADHQLWVSLGSEGWAGEIGPVYGAPEKPVGGFGAPMPSFSGLTELELAQVSLYERVAFGGEAVDEAEADCGLAGEESMEAMAP